ncbi:MAG: endolytic transglycosylase MltG [Patescibacteria group bacterium]|nr:endolytic transglycosylase MltG [Patescibacteria group bacterium]
MNPQFEQRGRFSFSPLIILGVVLLLLLFIAYFFYGLQPLSWSDEVMGRAGGSGGGLAKFKIIRGESFRDIGARLSSESFIKSIFIFKLYSLLSGNAQKFQPGLYELSQTMSVPQIVRALTEGGKNEVTITIPEGSTLRDIDLILSSALVIEENSLTNFPLRQISLEYPFLLDAPSLEGFLFPDTYRFYINSKTDDVLRSFLDNFKMRAWPLLSGEKKWYETLIAASFLEREVPEFDDRQIVAGILMKRLKLGIPFQVDATISYAKCGGLLKNCEQALVTREDLKISSPYNTYQRLGWTPTPIANPGQTAIKAALTPKTSPYLYYLSSKTSETIFSKTLEEHNTKKAKYL